MASNSDPSTKHKESICIYLEIIVPNPTWRPAVAEVLKAWLTEMDELKNRAVENWGVWYPNGASHDDLDNLPPEWHLFATVQREDAPEDLQDTTSVCQKLGRIFQEQQEQQINGHGVMDKRLKDVVKFESVEWKQAWPLKDRGKVKPGLDTGY